MHLLAYCWNDEHCSLPGDDGELIRLTGISKKIWASSPQIRGKFVAHPQQVSRRTNAKLWQEWSKIVARRSKCSEQGKVGAEKRWGGHSAATWGNDSSPPLAHTLEDSARENTNTEPPAEPTPSKPTATTPRARSRKRTTAPAAEYPAEYATLLQRHQQALHRYQGVVRTTVLDAESADVCRKLMASCGGDFHCMERSLAYVDLFCQSTDPYVVKRAWAWRVLVYRLDELAAEYTRRTESEEVREKRRCDLEAETLKQLYGVEVEG